MSSNSLIYKPDRNSSLAVTSRSFAKNEKLRDELTNLYPNTRFNEEGIQLKGHSLIEFLDNCDMAITSLETIDESIVKCLPKLKIISKYGVGIDMIDLHALYKHNIRLGWQGGVNKRAVSELVLAFMLNLLRNIQKANNNVSNGIWTPHGEFVDGTQLTNKTIGIIGLGHIGKDIVNLLKPFQCKIIANDLIEFKDFCGLNNIIQTDLTSLLKKSDIITIHVPLDESTRYLIGPKQFNYMKHECYLINTARGNIVDEKELKSALKGNRIAGAAFDVFADEPPLDHELLGLKNFITTPHIAGMSTEAMSAMGGAAISGLVNAKEALPENY
jgi:D-3-phosphoglycerate dehydrogenase